MTVEIERWADRSELLRSGMTGRQIDADCRSGELSRLRPGRYVSASSFMAGDNFSRHVLRAEELVSAMAGRAVVSHQSAALLHHFDLPPIDLPRVHLTWPGSGGRRGTANVHPHRGQLDDEDVVLIGGLPVTSGTRTVFDVARSATAAVAVSTADSALRTGAVSRLSLDALLVRTQRVPGHHRASRVLAFADARAESVGESITRLRIAQLGLPDPALQVVLSDVRHRIGIRVDFEVIEYRTVVEFDGKIKYGRLLRSGQSAGDAVFEEKRREDAIRATGRQCVRIVWDELHPARFRATLLPRFQAAFTRAGFPDWRPEPGRFLSE